MRAESGRRSACEAELWLTRADPGGGQLVGPAGIEPATDGLKVTWSGLALRMSQMRKWQLSGRGVAVKMAFSGSSRAAKELITRQVRNCRETAGNTQVRGRFP